MTDLVFLDILLAARMLSDKISGKNNPVVTSLLNKNAIITNSYMANEIAIHKKNITSTNVYT